MTAATGNLAVLLEGFFTRRLMQQRQASAHTIASYRDTFRLFLRFAEKRLKVAPSALALEQLDAPLIAAFLGTRRRCQKPEPAAERYSVLLSVRRL